MLQTVACSAPLACHWLCEVRRFWPSYVAAGLGRIGFKSMARSCVTCRTWDQVKTEKPPLSNERGPSEKPMRT